MSIEALSNEIVEQMKQEIKDKENTTGCHVAVENDTVKVTIPVNGENKFFIFPKREVRELFERLYSE